MKLPRGMILPPNIEVEGIKVKPSTKYEIRCPHCAEINEYFEAYNFEGRIKCLNTECNRLFFICIEDGGVTLIKMDKNN